MLKHVYENSVPLTYFPAKFLSGNILKNDKWRYKIFKTSTDKLECWFSIYICTRWWLAHFQEIWEFRSDVRGFESTFVSMPGKDIIVIASNKRWKKKHFSKCFSLQHWNIYCYTVHRGNSDMDKLYWGWDFIPSIRTIKTTLSVFYRNFTLLFWCFWTFQCQINRMIQSTNNKLSLKRTTDDVMVFPRTHFERRENSEKI